eukprot:403370230
MKDNNQASHNNSLNNGTYQKLNTQQRNVSNPIPQNMKTIRDILPDPDTYQQIYNSPNRSPQNRKQINQSQISPNKSVKGQDGVIQLEIQELNQQHNGQHKHNNSKISADYQTNRTITNDDRDYQEELNDRVDDDIYTPSNNHYNQTIVDNREIRVAELESIVNNALEKTNAQLTEAKQNQLKTHRAQLKGETPEVQGRNQHLKQLQKIIVGQQREIVSLKNRLEALDTVQKVTDIDNQVADLERQNKQTKKQFKILELRNHDQQKSLNLLTQDTEYEEQMNQLKREINKWREKHQMLAIYKKEEDAAFKQKFEQMVDINQERHKIKQSIIEVKYNPATALVNNDETYHSKNKSVVVGKTMGRSVSQAQIRNNINDLDNLVKNKNAIEKVLYQQNKVFTQNKKDLERQEQALLEEIENIKLQIVNTDKINEFTQQEIKECQLLQQQMQTQQQSKMPNFINHSRQHSSQLRTYDNSSIENSQAVAKTQRALKNAKITYQGGSQNNGLNGSSSVSRLRNHKLQQSSGNIRSILQNDSHNEQKGKEKGYQGDNDQPLNSNQSFLDKVQQQKHSQVSKSQNLKPSNSTSKLSKQLALQQIQDKQQNNKIYQNDQSILRDSPPKELLSEVSFKQMNQYLVKPLESQANNKIQGINGNKSQEAKVNISNSKIRPPKQ